MRMAFLRNIDSIHQKKRSKKLKNSLSDCLANLEDLQSINATVTSCISNQARVSAGRDYPHLVALQTIAALRLPQSAHPASAMPLSARRRHLLRAAAMLHFAVRAVALRKMASLLNV